MPRAIELARLMIIDRHLEDRFEVRDQGVEDLQDTCEYDLAWIPAPFIPQAVFNRALAHIHNSIVPGGWIIVAAGRLEGDDIGVSVTKWQTVLAGGTAITATEAHTMLADNGFANITTIPPPPAHQHSTAGNDHQTHPKSLQPPQCPVDKPVDPNADSWLWVSLGLDIASNGGCAIWTSIRVCESCRRLRRELAKNGRLGQPWT